MTRTRLKAMLEKLLKENANTLAVTSPDLSKHPINERVEVLYNALTSEYSLEEILDLKFVNGNIGVRCTGMSARDYFKQATINYIESLFEPYAIEYLTYSQIEKISKQSMIKINRAILEAIGEEMQFYKH